MSVPDNTPGVNRRLVDRVTGILLRTDAEWDVIDTEPATVKGLFTGYAMILAAIGPIAGLFGSVLGGHLFGLVGALVGAVLSYAFALLGVFIVSIIIDTLAPNFASISNRVQATKVAVYSSTAGWVAGVLLVIPGLRNLVFLLSLYGLWLLYRGLPKLMKTPPDKAVAYTAVVVVVAIVVQWVMIAAAAFVVGLAALGAVGSVVAANSASNNINIAALEASAKQAEASAKQLQAQLEGKTVEGAVTALPGDTLKALLPGAVAGFARTEVESSSGGVGGIQGSNAQGSYEKGQGRMTLAVTDMAAAGGLAGIAGAFNVSSSKETATGYEKMGTVGGRMTTENYDRANQSGEYSVLVANRFMVQAQGSGVSMDELKAAVGAVGLDRLEVLAKG